MYSQFDSGSVLKLAEYRRKDLRRSITVTTPFGAEDRVIQLLANTQDPAA